jgi:GntR family transcriptional regulator/MocR family aminotransferase
MRLPQIDPSASIAAPLYQQIADHFRRAVESGELEDGARLPSIRNLAGELGVHRDTAALAYEALVEDGLLESAVGRGTFVRPRARAAAFAAPAEGRHLALAPQVERLLEFERARPRLGREEGAIPLHSLIPDPRLYPVEGFRRAFNRVVKERGSRLFLYGGPQGDAGLREVLARRLRKAGIGVGADEVVLCHGASQGISLAVRLFAEAGEAVAVESPTYHNVLGTLHALGVRPVPVPMRRDGPERGPDLGVLEEVLRRPDVKAFYTIPTFHNPMGLSTTLEMRRALLEVASRRGKPLLEDAFEMDLRYDGRPVPPLAALDASGLVVHLTSFSKSLFPGVRAGTVTARGRLVEGLVALKHATDLSDSLPLQAALAEFVSSGAFDRHLARLRRTLRARRDALLEALARELPSGTHWTVPEGGYQVWVTLPGGIDAGELVAPAEAAGVLFAPGARFLPDGGASPSLRLTVAMADEDEIRRGVQALGRAVRERLRERPVRRAAASVEP